MYHVCNQKMGFEATFHHANNDDKILFDQKLYTKQYKIVSANKHLR